MKYTPKIEYKCRNLSIKYSAEIPVTIINIYPNNSINIFSSYDTFKNGDLETILNLLPRTMCQPFLSLILPIS